MHDQTKLIINLFFNAKVNNECLLSIKKMYVYIFIQYITASKRNVLCKTIVITAYSAQIAKQSFIRSLEL